MLSGSVVVRKALFITLLMPAGLLVSVLYVHAQTKRIDSLLGRVYKAKEAGDRLSAMLAVCDEYKTLNRDTLDRYAFMAYDMSLKSGTPHQRTMAVMAVANDYSRWGWLDSAMAMVEPVIHDNKVTDAGGRPLYFKASRLKAMCYAGHSRYQEALAMLYRVVSEAETYRDSLTLAENFSSIASIALERGQASDAVVWLYRALQVAVPSPACQPIRAAIYVNLAEAFHQLGQKDSAQIYITKGIGLFRQTEVLTNLATALQRQSRIFIDAGELDKAEATLREIAMLRRRLADGDMYQDENISLINFYIQTHQMEKAIQTCLRLLRMGDVHSGEGGESFSNNINIRLGYYEALARCYKITGNNLEYGRTLEQIIAAKDSFYQSNSARAIAELQTKYEVFKKENTIIQQQLDITRKNNRFYALLGIGFSLVVIAIVIFTGYRKRQRLELNAMLEKEKLFAEQSIVRAEENERKRIAADLHDNLGAHAASIVSNLDVIAPAVHDAGAMTAVKALRRNSLDVVSQLNDTIWALKKDALSLTALSDRIKAFVQRLEPSYPSVVLTVLEDVETDLMLSPSHALHLFRIVQEAVNNALRHGRGSEVFVRVVSDAAAWVIEVSDNGRGFGMRTDAAEGFGLTQPGAGSGNGLGNMRERAEKSGWEISWGPGENGGTMVRVTGREDNII